MIGKKAPSFGLKGTDGYEHKLEDCTAKVIVIIFSCNHCPYANAYDQRIKAMYDDFIPEVKFFMINSNDAKQYPEDSFKEMISAAQTKNFSFPYLYDETQEVAKAYQAVCTPHVFVVDKQRIIRYQGAIDDNWREADLASKRYLVDAIESLLDDQDPNPAETNPLGCSIKWKK